MAVSKQNSGVAEVSCAATSDEIWKFLIGAIPPNKKFEMGSGSEQIPALQPAAPGPSAPQPLSAFAVRSIALLLGFRVG